MATVEEVRGTSFATVAGKAPSKQRGANHPPVDVRLGQNTSVWVRRTLRRAAGRPSAYTYWLERLVAELSKIAEDYGAKYRKSRNDLAAERKLVRELRGKINETLPPGELAPSQAELDAAERRVQDLKNEKLELKGTITELENALQQSKQNIELMRVSQNEAAESQQLNGKKDDKTHAAVVADLKDKLSKANGELEALRTEFATLKDKHEQAAAAKRHEQAVEAYFQRDLLKIMMTVNKLAGSIGDIRIIEQTDDSETRRTVTFSAGMLDMCYIYGNSVVLNGKSASDAEVQVHEQLIELDGAGTVSANGLLLLGMMVMGAYRDGYDELCEQYDRTSSLMVKVFGPPETAKHQQ